MGRKVQKPNTITKSLIPGRGVREQKRRREHARRMRRIIGAMEDEGTDLQHQETENVTMALSGGNAFPQTAIILFDLVYWPYFQNICVNLNIFCLFTIHEKATSLCAQAHQAQP